MASKTYNNIYSYISQYNNITNKLGLGVYNSLLNTQVTTNVVATKTSSEDTKKTIIHSDDLDDDTFKDTIGVYYVNYNNIINTLNRNIGGSDYSNQDYIITDEGSNLGQREGVDFESFKTNTPLFLSDSERDNYSQYIEYIENNYGIPTLKDSNLLTEGQSGYTVGVKRGYSIGLSVNPNSDSIDTLLGKMSTMALSNIVNFRNIRKEQKGFQGITNINYYDTARKDIQESKDILSLDTSVGFSFSESLPNYGIKKEYAFVGFGNTTLDYVYSSVTQNYSFFDRWGELTNSTIALNSSPAYNSMKKSVAYGNDAGTLFISTDGTVDMTRFLIHNLKFKNGYNSDESITSYFGLHSFDVNFDDKDAKHRYLITTGTIQDTLESPRIDFHYDEGALKSDFETSNAGTNHSSYILSDSVYGAYGKDLTYATNNAFKKSKYDTIISKFDTGIREKYSRTQTAVSNAFGMSHGRNLLKVEKNSNGKVIGVDTSGGNGYENPYCRVWTYHHQYHRLYDSIRPFGINVDDEYIADDISKKEEIAKYRNSWAKVEYKDEHDEDIQDFRVINAKRIQNSEGQTLLRDRGALNPKNGLVNITPTSYDEESEERIKTKNCMFSIENLAWKDISKDKYYLSREQIGPFGGRIMWFPPYGLTFSENISTNWNTNTFIGRGENIYTYSNTERGGSLGFMLLIDHPSIINEWRTEEKGTTQDVDDIQSTEQKILRFFAGCEYLSNMSVSSTNAQSEETTENTHEPIVKTPHVPEKGSFSFVVYFPNNYSGVDDSPEEAVSYLLNGLLYGETEEGSYKLGYDILNYEYLDGSIYYTASQVHEIIYDNIIFNNTTKALTEAKAYTDNPYGELSRHESSALKFNKLSTNEKVKSLCFSFEAYICFVEKVYGDNMPKAINPKTRERLRRICGDSTKHEYRTDSIDIIWEFINEDNELKYYLTEEINLGFSGNDNFINLIGQIFYDGYISIDETILNEYKLVSKPLEVSEKIKDITAITMEDCAEIASNANNFEVLREISKYRNNDNVMLVHYADKDLYKYFLIPNDVFVKLVYNSVYDNDYLISRVNALFMDIHGDADYDLMADYKDWFDKGSINKGEELKPSTDGGDYYTCGYEMRTNGSGDTFGISTKGLANGNFYSSENSGFISGEPYNVGDYTVVYSKSVNIIDNSNKTSQNTFFAPWNKTVTSNGKNTPKYDYEHSWGYRVDTTDNLFDERLLKLEGQYNNYTDGVSSGLNASGYTNSQAKIFLKDLWQKNNPIFSFAEIVAALKHDYKDSKALKDVINEEHVKDIQKYIEYGISKIRVQGSASIQGNYDEGVVLNKGKDKDKDYQNDQLSKHRAETIQTWLKNNISQKDIDFEKIEIIPRGTSQIGGSIGKIDMKVQRCAVVEIEYDETISINAREGLTKYGSISGTSGTSGNTVQLNNRDGNVDNQINPKDNILPEITVNGTNKFHSIRYDNEANFFKTLKVTDPFLHHRIVDKIKYFDPAFHSITPEGFAARLTFLQQCTRQGNTIGASDVTRQNATNLAFGRPPVCILRIGDFYYTKIIIESINITYENGNGIQWDLNQEGIGVMPMYAKIEINFKFIGGSDLEGPISRLQNALSFNYYANTRVYDNRSDKVEYENGLLKNIEPRSPY